MRAEFTAIIEQVPEVGYWAICFEILGPMDRVKL